MNKISVNQVILGPIVTEKSLQLQDSGKYSFWVSRNSSKHQIAVAFQQAFGLEPISVNTSILKGKIKTDWKKRMPITKQDRKKAIIAVKKDQKIELLNLSAKK